jgi:hypothetical protein
MSVVIIGPIIAKHGNGPPPTLADGEIAFDHLNHKFYTDDESRTP